MGRMQKATAVDCILWYARPPTPAGDWRTLAVNIDTDDLHLTGYMRIIGVGGLVAL